MSWGLRFWLGLAATLALGIPLALAYAPALDTLQTSLAAIHTAGAEGYAAGYWPRWTARILGVALSGVGVGILLLAYLALIILPRGR